MWSSILGVELRAKLITVKKTACYVDSWEHGYEPSGSMKCREFSNELIDY
jgi:hypothetical protein